MVRVESARRLHAVLLDNLSDLRRYRERISREQLRTDRDAQHLVLHALYLAVQASVDLALHLGVLREIRRRQARGLLIFVAPRRTGMACPSPKRDPTEIVDDGAGDVDGRAMLDLLVSITVALASMFRSRQSQALEILALREQLAVYKRTSTRPKLRVHDRVFWVWLSRLWGGWRNALIVVRPETVIAWHRKGFKLYWTWKSRRGRGHGRPPVSQEVRDLVRRMAMGNPTWGAPRIHGELIKLGFEVSERTVSRLIARAPKPPSQTWRTFLANHMSVLASAEFFVVYTITFQLLYVFVILEHERRPVVHFGVPAHPSAEWTANHVVQAFPFDTAPRYMIRDRDKI